MKLKLPPLLRRALPSMLHIHEAHFALSGRRGLRHQATSFICHDAHAADAPERTSKVGLDIEASKTMHFVD